MTISSPHSTRARLRSATTSLILLDTLASFASAVPSYARRKMALSLAYFHWCSVLILRRRAARNNSRRCGYENGAALCEPVQNHEVSGFVHELRRSRRRVDRGRRALSQSLAHPPLTHSRRIDLRRSRAQIFAMWYGGCVCIRRSRRLRGAHKGRKHMLLNWTNRVINSFRRRRRTGSSGIRAARGADRDRRGRRRHAAGGEVNAIFKQHRRRAAWHQCIGTRVAL